MLLTILFGLMTPLGLITGYVLEVRETFAYMDLLLAIVVGMFLHISTTIIFETTENHKFNLMKLMSIVVGCGLAMIMY